MKDKKKKMGSDPFGFIGSSKTIKEKKKIKEREVKSKNSKKEYKHTSIQTKKGRISEVGERATFYVRPELLTEIKILSIKTREKNISELVNEALKDIIKKYKEVLIS